MASRRSRKPEGQVMPSPASQTASAVQNELSKDQLLKMIDNQLALVSGKAPDVTEDELNEEDRKIITTREREFKALIARLVAAVSYQPSPANPSPSSASQPSSTPPSQSSSANASSISEEMLNLFIREVRHRHVLQRQMQSQQSAALDQTEYMRRLQTQKDKLEAVCRELERKNKTFIEEQQKQTADLKVRFDQSLAEIHDKLLAYNDEHKKQCEENDAFVIRRFELL